jgi:hypothetical protein
MKDDPHHQTEAHHFHQQVNGDLMQCVLFDGNTASANLTGIEYIVSERLFERLPQEERRWHLHKGEILSGQLIAQGLPEIAETALMRSKMNSHGKRWHLWDTGGPGATGRSFRSATQGSPGASTATARRTPAFSSRTTHGSA